MSCKYHNNKSFENKSKPDEKTMKNSFQINEKKMEHSRHWIVNGQHGEEWDSQNNEKTMEHSDHWIMTG